MKRNIRKRFNSKKNNFNYEKRFVLKFAICLIILSVFFVISKTNSARLDTIKNYIVNTLDESTDISGTKDAITMIFSRIKDNFDKKDTIPASNTEDDQVPMASYSGGIKSLSHI